jgi:hypothetical protein
MLIPFLIGIGGSKESRKKVHESLAPILTKLAPDIDLAAVDIGLRDLMRPMVNNDGQGNIPGRAQIVQRPRFWSDRAIPPSTPSGALSLARLGLGPESVQPMLLS